MSDIPKGIGSLAKKQADVTRQGTQKLKFTPTLPLRRKNPTSESSNTPTRDSDHGSGSTDIGQGRGRGRGRGRGAPTTEMTASGPFAMGPALAGSQTRRSVTRPEPGPPTPASLDSSLGVKSARRGIQNDVKGKVIVKDEEEEYSDPDDGVEIIDMNKIKDMDWMAPEGLRVEHDADNMIAISSSDGDPSPREDRLYFFQFPAPFPRFLKKESERAFAELTASGTGSNADLSAKKVSFAPDTKPSLAPTSPPHSSTPPAREELIDGTIGLLETYKSGKMKIRLANGILFDVSAGSQPSFLQQAAYLDMDNKQLTVLGEVEKQFVLSPDVEALLESMEKTSMAQPMFDGGESLIKMDTT